MADKVDISKINIDFGEDDKLKDKYLLKLLSRAYKGEKICRHANIKMESIIPFTDDEPEISEEFRSHFMKKAEEEKYIPMFVYQRDGKFIMSDDYNSYSIYKELKLDVVPCVIIGDITDVKSVVSMGELFQLEAPTVQRI